MRFNADNVGLRVNVSDKHDLLDRVRASFTQKTGFALATLNLDHLAKIQRHPEFARVYAAQDLVVADGRPIVWLSRMAASPVSLVPGSDLVRPLAALAAQCGVRVALVGTTTAALEDARRVLMSENADLDITVCVSPSLGFDPDGDEALAILQELDRSGVGLCFVALGAPKQEAFAARGRSISPGVGFASLGAGLDFIGGHQLRAPVWMRAVALEWLWRMLGSPIRLGPRYIRCASIFPRQVLLAVRQRWTLKTRTDLHRQ